jgi:DNA-binding NarL/FixJ family response regulator
MIEKHETAVVVGENAWIRYGIAAMLGRESWLDVCGETGEAPAARRLCEEEKPDFIVLDADFANADPLTLLRDLMRLHPPVCILVLSEQDDVEWLQRVFQAGAYGYLWKRETPRQLLNALSRFMQGEKRFISHDLSGSLLQRVTNGRIVEGARGIEALSTRELEVFRLVGQGKGATAMARGLGLSVKTIETHHKRIKEKLGVKTLQDLKRRATEWLLAANAHVVKRPSVDSIGPAGESRRRSSRSNAAKQLGQI